MERPTRQRAAFREAILSGFAALLLCVPGAAANAATGHAHQHGTAELEVVLEGDTLGVSLQVPLDSLLGFERAPRTERERAQAKAVLERMRGVGQLLEPDAAAACVPAAPAVTADVLTGQARVAGEHAELQAQVSYRCARPAQLKRIRVGLFEVFPRIQRINARWATPAGQGKAVLRPAAPVFVLQR